MLPTLLSFFFVVGSVLGCLREPTTSGRYRARSVGDNGYAISVHAAKSYLDTETYVPGTAYTVTLSGSQTFNNLQQFTHFILGIEPQHNQFVDAQDLHPLRLGQFMLFPDSLVQYKQDCINTVKEANTLAKSEVKVMWMAPPAGSGCIVFRAMVMESRNKWWADDGGLSKTICEADSRNEENTPGECCACDEAKYRMVFEGLWSSETHPKDFPISSKFTHFSDIIGASHDPMFRFWGEKQIATDGFRTLAEWGSGGLLLQELRGQSPRLRSIVKAAGLWYPRVNANTTATFKVDRRHPQVSLASMFGPSPDWMVGVIGLDLCQKDCTWKESLTLDLLPWDAGTDSGISYLSPNTETSPRERMYPITTMYPEDPRAPFYDPAGGAIPPLARLFLFRENVIAKNCDDAALQVQVEETENTENGVRPECETSPFSEWSPCSATCGKGLRMRTREYLMPMKAAMMNCDRQLVAKEMCVARVEECGPGSPFSADDSEEALEDLSDLCSTTAWGSWSECSSTCGEGVRRRTRKFQKSGVQKKCYHVKRVSKEKCNGPPCPPSDAILEAQCPVSPWSDWSPCSTTCGNGVQQRTRLLLLEPSQTTQCAGRILLDQIRQCTDSTNCSGLKSKEACNLPAEPGPCRSVLERYYFNTRKQNCQKFVYGGCRGNENRFDTREQCEESCQIVA